MGLILRDVKSVFYKVVLGSISVREALDEAVHANVPAGGSLTIAEDGNGVGCVVFASLAMRLFGPHLSSLTYGFLSLVGLSTVAFLLRYQDVRVFVVPFFFSALTVMLLTPLATSEMNLGQAPIGGIRYFVIAGILPTLHLFFEVTDRDRQRPRLSVLPAALSGLQIFIFAVANLVRNGAGYLLGPLLAGSVMAIRARRGADVSTILRKIGFGMAMLIASISVIFAWLPGDYLEAGRAFGIMWHRAVISFGANPTWPFPGIHDSYRCEKAIPEGIVPGIVDRNGHCIWLAYGPNRDRPIDELSRAVHSGQYELAMREAYFHIIRVYPRDTLETLLYYKPRLILQTLLRAFSFDVSGRNGVVALLVLFQFLIIILASAVTASDPTFRSIRTLLLPFLLLSLFSLPPYIIAWSLPWTVPDLISYVFSFILLISGVAAERGFAKLREERQNTTQSVSPSK